MSPPTGFHPLRARPRRAALQPKWGRRGHRAPGRGGVPGLSQGKILATAHLSMLMIPETTSKNVVGRCITACICISTGFARTIPSTHRYK